MATTSAREPTVGYPFSNPWDIADGRSGVPYFYMTDMEMSVIDLLVRILKITLTCDVILVTCAN